MFGSLRGEAGDRRDAPRVSYWGYVSMIGLVRVALRRPYTMAIAGMLIMLGGFLVGHPHGRRHLPQHRHPGRLCRLELSRPVRRGHGAARRPGQRARLFDHGQRHRAHRVAVDPGPRHPQGLFQPGHRHRRRHRADLRAEQLDPAHRAARHHAAEHDPVQRLERAGRAGHAQQQDHARAADLRLRAQLPAHPAVHHPRPVDAGALRRQAAPDHRRRRSRRG